MRGVVPQDIQAARIHIQSEQVAQTMNMAAELKDSSRISFGNKNANLPRLSLFIGRFTGKHEAVNESVYGNLAQPQDRVLPVLRDPAEVSMPVLKAAFVIQ